MKLTILPALCVLFAGAPGLCGTQGLGTVTGLTSQPAIANSQPGVFFFNTNGARVSPPTCATLPDRWAIDGSPPGSQQTIATIMSAQAQHKQVAVYGTGNCSIWGDTESVQHIEVLTP